MEKNSLNTAKNLLCYLPEVRKSSLHWHYIKKVLICIFEWTIPLSSPKFQAFRWDHAINHKQEMQEIYLEVHPVTLEPQETAGRGNKTAAPRSHMSPSALKPTQAAAHTNNSLAWW